MNSRLLIAVTAGIVLGISDARAGDTAQLQTMDTAGIIAARPSSLDMASAGRIYNPEAPVPPQCYTAIEAKFNPCYVCHQSNDDTTRTNFMQDGELQEAYNFSDAGLTNHYRNLFIDRGAAIEAMSDDEILAYVGEENYSALAGYLREREFSGWIPDLENYENGAAAFDDFGLARNGSFWVAFNYKPQPSTFWPTNGSTDDVLIRLPERFRTLDDGTVSRDVYFANLALLEIAFQDYETVSLPPVDEKAVGTDLDGDGILSVANTIRRRETYLGAAADENIVRMNYPEGTEFLHSVRYVGVSEGGDISVSPRMKELRYMQKSRQLSISALKSRYGNESQEKIDENLPRYVSLGDRGMDNGFGWTLLAFIEDANGALRPQTREEQFFCRGCHTSVGANIDQTWAFPRKVRGVTGWGYVDYYSVPDAPNVGSGGEGEILTYFKRVGGGDEFRSNTEMLERWFNADGTVDEAAVDGKTVYDLIAPSRERALMLNKAYRAIVLEQSFIFGRDATVTPPKNVHAEIDSATAPTLPPDKRYKHDIRLDWDAVGIR